ncbi:hypothetical protein LIER_08143 [Lithospermum erythrorhizon]|uniref:Uncharacterized protein n=1 Tax=Lithospermum erythrorhizon TaxID=34254 RepID=A0AAV3PF72_LITER
MKITSIKGYWNRRGRYEKLTGSSAARRRKSTRLGVVNTPTESPSSHHRMRTLMRTLKRRFSWRLNPTRRLKLNKLRYICSPKKFLGGLGDAYINFMNKFADSKVITDGIGGGYAGATDDGFATRSMKEYDEKMIIEIYKSIIIAQGQLVQHRDAPRIGT